MPSILVQSDMLGCIDEYIETVIQAVLGAPHLYMEECYGVSQHKRLEESCSVFLHGL